MRKTCFLRLAVAVLVFWMVPALSIISSAQVSISLTFGPPPLPVYEQPLCPGEGYIWTPGYWAYDYDEGDYYWVPGTWVEAPEPGLLWTPGYWGWNGASFIFHDGYWGPHVGFYGGIDYGYGYVGHGYEGGRWDNGRFFYNRSVNNINVTNIHNVYNTTVVNTTTVNRISYNGGEGGINARPRPDEDIAERDRHIARVAAQNQHIQEARADRELRASVNRGKPPIAATPKPGDFRDHVVAAREAGGPYRPPANRPAAHGAPAPGPGNNPAPNPHNNVDRPNGPIHPNDLPHGERPPAPNTGNQKMDQKYQQQQQKMYAKEEQQRQKLQQKQDQEHQRMAQRQANDARNQQLEQKHQQQTQRLEQQQEKAQQKMQARQQPHQNQARPEKEKPQR